MEEHQIFDLKATIRFRLGIPNKKMKLKTYIQILQNFVEQNPEAADLITVTASDDEGNSFDAVDLDTLCIGIWDKEEGDFYIPDDEDEKINAVCVN